MNFFSIVIDTCNQEKWIKKCVDSAINQKYDNFEVIVMDAKSDDNTYNILKEYKNIKLYQNEIRVPQIANMVNLTKLAKDNSIVVSVDGDDWLKDENVLSHLNSIYTPDVWMTYGRYEEFPYRDVSHVYQPYPEHIIRGNLFRAYRWMASHLRTYRKELFLKIKEEDFKFKNGNWFDTAGDQAFQLPMLEMAGFRSRHIPEILYVYNMANVSRDGYLNEKRQEEVAAYIRKLPPYSIIDSL